MLDESEIYIKELSHTIINLYKLTIEDMGYDMGDTNNEIEYRNYLSSDPIYFYKDDESTFENGDTIDSSIDFSNYIGGIISIDKLMQIYPKANRNYAAAAVSALDKSVSVFADRLGSFLIFERAFGNSLVNSSRGFNKRDIKIHKLFIIRYVIWAIFLNNTPHWRKFTPNAKLKDIRAIIASKAKAAPHS